jgi:hypothetical protein
MSLCPQEVAVVVQQAQKFYLDDAPFHPVQPYPLSH